MNFAELPKAFADVSGVYELKRTLELSMGSSSYRVELYLNHSNANAPWHGRVYEEVGEKWEKIRSSAGWTTATKIRQFKLP